MPDRHAIVNNMLHKHYYTTLTFKKVDLDKLVERTDLSRVYLSPKMELAICHITAMVKGSTISEISYPSDWWQAFRERWLPKWWLNGHPVDYTCWQVDKHYPPLYPEGIIRVYNNKVDQGYLYHA